MIYFFLQAIPTPPTPSNTETYLLYLAITAVIGCGGLITWAIKSLIPKLVEQFEKRTESLDKVAGAVPGITKAVEASTEAVKGIKELVSEVRMEIRMITSKEGQDTRDKIEKAKDDIIEEIHDMKFKDLHDRISSIDKSPKS